MYQELIYDAQTGQTTIRKFTPEEIEQAKAAETEAKKLELERKAEEKARQAVLNKLGLTKEEIALLLNPVI